MGNVNLYKEETKSTFVTFIRMLFILGEKMGHAIKGRWEFLSKETNECAAAPPPGIVTWAR